MEIMREWILQFGTFLLDQLALLLLTVILANIFIGVMVSIKKQEFSVKAFLEGCVSGLFLLISYALIGVFIFILTQKPYADLQIFVTAFSVLTLLIIAYKANSMLLNFVFISKIPMPKIMQELDTRVKALFEKEYLPKDEALIEAFIDHDKEPVG